MATQTRIDHLRAALDLSATFVTIATCVFVCVLLVLNRTKEDGTDGAQLNALSIGSYLKSPAEVGFDASDLTVLIGMSSKCRFCAESLPAFRVLDEFLVSQDPSRVRGMALGPESAEKLTGYLGQSGLTAFRVTAVEEDSDVVRVMAKTPSIVVVNRSGRIVAARTGRMSTGQMNEFIKRHLSTDARKMDANGLQADGPVRHQ